MKYAEVAVNIPGGHRHAFTYSIPVSLRVVVGQGVWVPFGAKTTTGIVIGLTDYSPVDTTRDILNTISDVPLISTEIGRAHV